MSVWRDSRKLVIRLELATDTPGPPETFRVVVTPPEESGEGPPDVIVERETTDAIGDPLWKAATPREFTTILALVLAHFADANESDVTNGWRTRRWNLGNFSYRGDVYVYPPEEKPDADPQDR